MAVYPRTAHAGAANAGNGNGVPAQPDFPALERYVLDYWQAHDTFRASGPH